MKFLPKNLNKVLILFFWAALFNCQSQEPLDRDSFLLTAIVTMLNQTHFLQKNINDDFYAKNFQLYVKSFDRNKLLLLRHEMEELQEKSFPGEKGGLEKVAKVAPLTYQIIQPRLEVLKAYIFPLLQSNDFSFTRKEIFESDWDKVERVKTIDGLKDRWRKYLKYEVLRRLLADESFLKTNKTSTTKAFRQRVGNIKLEVVKNTKRFFSRYRAFKSKDYLNFYLNAIAASYDDYSTYLPPVEKETFDIRMSGQMEGIGAQITQSEDGYIDVVSIIPGGASYRQKELQVGDVIIKVGQSNEKPVDLGNLTVNDALALIRGKKGTLVRLIVRKKNGEIKNIPIFRDTIVLKETYTKSIMLKKQGRRFGYIYLPKFYRDFNKKIVKNSTQDVKDALMRFNKEAASGLILDLRNNGGGALDDAILMSGLFIEKGPILQVKDRNRIYPPLSDNDNEVAFNKPMVVLINEYSASASEILAGALQDYGRAIIVGGKKSFGKGTVQTINSLNQSFADIAKKYDQDFGALKYTVQKFYRITGKSPQTVGVIPDISLPDRNIRFDNEKKENPYTETIPSLTYNKWSAFSYDLPVLEKQSKARVSKNPFFKNIKKYNMSYEEKIKQAINLNYTNARKYQLAHLQELERYESNAEEETVKTEVFTLSNSANPSLEETRGAEWFKGLRSDQYVGESLSLLLDQIK